MLTSPEVIHTKHISEPIADQREIIACLDEYRKKREELGSQRKAALSLNIPRGTIRHWLNNEDNEVEFLNTNPGLEFITKIYNAALFSFHLKQSSSVDAVSEFLTLSGLSKYIAPSHGSVYKAALEMIAITGEFGDKEDKRLGKLMPHKMISYALDESFYKSKPYLVGIEPVSNFILLEKQSDNRQSETWAQAIYQSIKYFNVQLFQSVGDEGSGIRKCVKEILGLYHSNDIFHVQYELVKATSGQLSAKVRVAERDVEKAGFSLNRPNEPYNADNKQEEKVLNKSTATVQQKSDDALVKELKISKEKLKALEEVTATAKESVKAIGDHYHPLNILTGDVHNGPSMKSTLNRDISIIEKIAQDQELTDKSLIRIKKAKKLVDSLARNITFFWIMVDKILNGALSSEAEKLLVKSILIPVMYVEKSIPLTEDKDMKRELSVQVKNYQTQLKNSELWDQLSTEQKNKLNKIALDCIRIFQRSSSNVEGRNSQVKTLYRNLHLLSEKRLRAFTAIHNYWIKRDDGTTAAERFFEHKPEDLFEYLMKNMSCPSRPASKRPQLKLMA